MRRLFAVLAVLIALVPLLAEARLDGYRWPKGSEVVVENQLAPRFNRQISEMVEAWDAITQHISFRVAHRNDGDCRYKQGRIVICPHGVRGASVGNGNYLVDGHAITAARIFIEKPVLTHGPLFCHEFAHTLGLAHNDQPETSCLGHGELVAPGVYDAESLRLLYKRKWRDA